MACFLDHHFGIWENKLMEASYSQAKPIYWKLNGKIN